MKESESASDCGETHVFLAASWVAATAGKTEPFSGNLGGKTKTSCFDAKLVLTQLRVSWSQLWGASGRWCWKHLVLPKEECSGGVWWTVFSSRWGLSLSLWILIEVCHRSLSFWLWSRSRFHIICNDGFLLCVVEIRSNFPDETSRPKNPADTSIREFAANRTLRLLLDSRQLLPLHFPFFANSSYFCIFRPLNISHFSPQLFAIFC